MLQIEIGNYKEATMQNKRMITIKHGEITITISKKWGTSLYYTLEKHAVTLLTLLLGVLSLYFFIYFYKNGMGLAYNDARSHLDIARRIVEGLTPGLAQLGSVWLPLPHILMIPTIWSDFFWHTGLSGGIISMVTFVGTGIVIYKFLQELGVGLLGRFIGVIVFAANINILYLQSTAMTELLLLFTMTIGVFDLVRWQKYQELQFLVTSAFWIMLSTLIRYDGWFLLIVAGTILLITTWYKKGVKATEGTLILFCTLAGVGVGCWLLWNLLIFNDPLYFAFGPFSAHAQQQQIDSAGLLLTKGNIFLSAKVYFYAVMYNSYTLIPLLSLIGAFFIIKDKKIEGTVRIASLALFSSLIFNIVALYLGHSVLFIQDVMGNTWFNVRYGIMLMPTIAIFLGYLFDKLYPLRLVFLGVFLLIMTFAWINYDAVTIDDARIGSSQKNVTEVSSWLKNHATNQKGFILISVASHDAIIFSSSLPMKRFIHEGTGRYWESAIKNPDEWARWIILRTNDMNDLTFKEIHNSPGFKNYRLVEQYPFADIYEIKNEYLSSVERQVLQFEK